MRMLDRAIGRRPRGSALVWIVGGLLLALAACGGEGSVQAGRAQKSQAFEIQFGDEVFLVESESIGVLAKQGADSQKLEELLTNEGFTLGERYDNGVVLYESGETWNQDSLVEIARGLQQNEDLVRQAGLVVRKPESRLPMLVTNRALVDFRPELTQDQIRSFVADQGATIVRRMYGTNSKYVLESTEGNAFDLLQRLEGRDEVSSGYPDFVLILVDRGRPIGLTIGDQWHHDNTGQTGGLDDADVDSVRAWGLTTGSPALTIAVLERTGFEQNHPALAPNLWQNPMEWGGALEADEDGNGLYNDVHGWSFANNSALFDAQGWHATSVAALAAADGSGASGTCPDCRMMLIQVGSTVSLVVESIRYAYEEGADVINLSFGFGALVPPITNELNAAATDGRDMGAYQLGCVIVGAMNDVPIDDCVAADVSSHEHVIAVSMSDHADRKGYTAAGPCMEVLAPGHWTDASGLNGVGIATADLSGNPGINDHPSVKPSWCSDVNDKDYTLCFSGTSAAAPITSGIAGLVLSAEPQLTAETVRKLLCDTADRVEHSLALYSTVDGFSTQNTHGYGRVNAYEAVRVVAPVAMGGRGGVDLFIRDNRLDWGNTEQPSNHRFDGANDFIPHWKSVDIKVDAPDPNAPILYQPAPTTSQGFDALVHENPIAQALNKVYVRVRNRGPNTASNVTVKLHWTFAGTALPSLPSDFWTLFPADSSDISVWNPMGVQVVPTIGYSGSSVAGKPGDAAAILSFDFNAPSLNPGQDQFRHHCLFAVVEGPQDPVSPNSKTLLVPDDITPTDNNVTHRNVQLQDPLTPGGGWNSSFFVRNPMRHAIECRLRVSLPPGVEAALRPVNFDTLFPLERGEELVFTVKIDRPVGMKTGDVDILQEWVDGSDARPMGGLTIRPPGKQALGNQ